MVQVKELGELKKVSSIIKVNRREAADFLLVMKILKCKQTQILQGLGSGARAKSGFFELE